MDFCRQKTGFADGHKPKIKQLSSIVFIAIFLMLWHLTRTPGNPPTVLIGRVMPVGCTDRHFAFY